MAIQIAGVCCLIYYESLIYCGNWLAKRCFGCKGFFKNGIELHVSFTNKTHWCEISLVANNKCFSSRKSIQMTMLLTSWQRWFQGRSLSYVPSLLAWRWIETEAIFYHMWLEAKIVEVSGHINNDLLCVWKDNRCPYSYFLKGRCRSGIWMWEKNRWWFSF